MEHFLTRPMPWYIGGPLIGLFVPVLLLLGNKQLGLSGSLRALCAAVAPGRVEFFRYDWKGSGLWNVALAFGLMIGGMTAITVLGASTPDIAPATREAIATLGLQQPSGMVPREVFNWHSFLTLRGFTCMIGGGFLIGFGASYGGGCTSGHGILGMATRQRASLVALIGIFAGGLFATFVLVPILF